MTSLASASILFGWGCGGPAGEPGAGATGDALLLAVSVFATNQDGSPNPLPARMAILEPHGDVWSHRFIEDPDSNVFHKAMPYRGGGAEGILTLGGTRAAVKLWKPDGSSDTVWEADFGGEFSRMRDAEVGDIYGDGAVAIAVATTTRVWSPSCGQTAPADSRWTSLVRRLTRSCMRSRLAISMATTR